MKRIVLLASMMVLLAQVGLAWRPSGWVYCLEGGAGLEYAYSQNEGLWYYVNRQPGGGAWAHNMNSGSWYYLTTQSALRAGWTFWDWPFAYCNFNRTWYYVDVSTPHWVANMNSRQWSRLGEQSSTVLQYEARAHQLVNNHRTNNGRSALAYNNSIASIARQHSQNMANGSVAFGHDGFDPGRINQVKSVITSSAWAENVVWNSGYADPPGQAVIGWINSPGHNANMLNPIYNCTGMGAAKAANGAWYFTQIFARTP